MSSFITFKLDLSRTVLIDFVDSLLELLVGEVIGDLLQQGLQGWSGDVAVALKDRAFSLFRTNFSTIVYQGHQVLRLINWSWHPCLDMLNNYSAVSTI